jgi:hypothetical protein
MTAPTTRLSYGDAYDALDRAKDDPKGIRIRFADLAAAQTFRSRVHNARQVDRRDNSTIYDPSDPLYGRSVYDPMIVRIRQDEEGFHWVYIEHTSIDKMVVENLSEADAAE